jgi:hypothetical protein
MATATKEKTEDETKTAAEEQVNQQKEQVNQQTGEVTTTTATDAVAADNYDYGQDAGAGFENQTSEDVSVPFIVLLQPGSPSGPG